MVILLLLLTCSFWSYDGFRSLWAVFFYSWLIVQLKKPSEEGKPYISGLYFIICSHSFAPFVIVVSLLTGSFSALCGTNNGKTSAEAYYCATDQCYDKCCKSKHILSPFVVVVSLLTGSFSALCGTNNGKTSAEAYYCATDQCYDKCCKSKHILSPFVAVFLCFWYV